MEVLQKITIYDLLGYTVPGTIMVGVLEKLFFGQLLVNIWCKEFFGYICGITILLGYVAGMVISEITSLLYETAWKIVWAIKNKFCKKESELDKLGVEMISKALAQAGIIEEETLLSAGEIERYYSYMYADIQSDPKYVRVHNYASSELVCKNTSFVLLVSSVLLLIFRQDILLAKSGYKISDVTLVILTIGIGSGILLFLRYLKQRGRKNTYTLDWFVQKHLEDQY